MRITKVRPIGGPKIANRRSTASILTDRSERFSRPRCWFTQWAILGLSWRDRKILLNYSLPPLSAFLAYSQTKWKHRGLIKLCFIHAKGSTATTWCLLLSLCKLFTYFCQSIIYEKYNSLFTNYKQFHHLYMYTSKAFTSFRPPSARRAWHARLLIISFQRGTKLMYLNLKSHVSSTRWPDSASPSQGPHKWGQKRIMFFGHPQWLMLI